LDCTSTEVSADIGFTWVQITRILPDVSFWLSGDVISVIALFISFQTTIFV